MKFSREKLKKMHKILKKVFFAIDMMKIFKQ